MSDLISRQDAIDAVVSANPKDREYHYYKHIAVGILNALPSADRQQGEWIFNPTDAIDLMFAKPKCSKCGFESSDGGNFCSNCGSIMKTE